MKKKYMIIMILLGVIILGIVTAKIYIGKKNIYVNIVNSNWNLEMSKNYEEIYSSNEGESFLGDGKRYHILKYNDNNINKNFEWESEKNLFIEQEVGKIIKSLNIDKKYTPNFKEQYKYYYRESEDFSKIYIIYFYDTKMIYIFGNFL
ncbi:hypothetical protein NSA50_15425 [Clostridium sp. DSM 100503]|uniref:hypothetical protein n=1 Tax=Clostridium sp. DSM 100503 TaxID=2963282 RepID=UPI00214A01A7|nr:hypothetical protein [Clostridium sp. DSM 100503]MCR1952419.1 hypothetical protein [Clostridium sp. DSM 100503]